MMENILKKNTTSLAVAGVGVVVAGIGRIIGGSLGAGITGYGLAHITLGLLDTFMPMGRK